MQLEQHGIADDMGVRRKHAKIDAPLNRRIFVVVSQAPEQRSKGDGRDLQAIGTFRQIKGVNHAIQLFGQFPDGSLSAIQPRLLGHGL